MIPQDCLFLYSICDSLTMVVGRQRFSASDILDGIQSLGDNVDIVIGPYHISEICNLEMQLKNRLPLRLSSLVACLPRLGSKSHFVIEGPFFLAGGLTRGQGMEPYQMIQHFPSVPSASWSFELRGTPFLAPEEPVLEVSITERS